MSQATFALALNVSTILISKWERGEVKPSGPSLKLLALAHKKGIDAIL
jgi:putative transcriptional regulator